MKPVHVTIALLLLIITQSCKKDSSRSSMIIEKKWKRTSIVVTLDIGRTYPDSYPDLPEYEKDDYYIFHNDSTYEVNDNIVLKPSATSAVLVHGFWYFTENQTYINLYNPGTGTQPPSKISKLTSDEFETATSFGGATEHIHYQRIN